MECNNQQLYEIVINKQTDLGRSRKNRTRIRKLITREVSKIDRIEETIVFRLPIWENDTFLTMYTDCSTDAFESITKKLEEKYPTVCTFKQYK